VLAYCGLSFAVWSIPADAMPPGPFWDFDKLIHAAEYAVLGALLALALSRTTELSAGLCVAIAWLIGSAYGVSDELHQWFTPGRHMSWGDVLADSAGSFAGAALFQWRGLHRRKR
jgi:VanZ family protein